MKLILAALLLTGCAGNRFDAIERRLRTLEQRDEAYKLYIQGKYDASELVFEWNMLDSSEEIERLADEGIREIRRYCSLRPWRCR